MRPAMAVGRPGTDHGANRPHWSPRPGPPHNLAEAEDLGSSRHREQWAYQNHLVTTPGVLPDGQLWPLSKPPPLAVALDYLR